MTKESADLRPTLWQGLRSAWPYFTNPPAPRAGKVIESRVGDLRYIAYVPDAVAPLPVLYHLHGAGMFWSWLRKDVHWIAEQHERAGADMIVIAPFDETGFSMWSNAIEHAVTNDLRSHVNETYAVKTGREHTHLQGFSMGGFGAASIGLRHADVYGTIAIFDGAMHDWTTMRRGHAGIASKQFEDDEAVFAEWSPWEWARRADLARTPIFMAEGLMTSYNRRFRDHLRDLGADVDYRVTSCLHDFRGLQEAVGADVIAFKNPGVGSS